MGDVLFVCVHNAGRSQMAKALFNSMARERGLRLTADSAGTIPGEHIHPNVVAVMKELGMDLSHEQPQALTNAMVDSAKRVITMGCAVDAEACPAIFLKNVEDWGLLDPKDRPPEEVRAIRDTIRSRVAKLIDSLEK